MGSQAGVLQLHLKGLGTGVGVQIDWLWPLVCGSNYGICFVAENIAVRDIRLDWDNGIGDSVVERFGGWMECGSGLRWGLSGTVRWGLVNGYGGGVIVAD